MKLLLLAILVLSLDACTTTYQGRQSQFMANFSLAPIITKIAPDVGYAIGKQGHNSQEMSTWKGRRIFHDEHDSFLLVEQAQQEDFMQRLKTEVEHTITGSGARVQATGGGEQHFHLRYTDDMNYGWIEVFGVKGEGVFKLIAIIHEM